MGKKGRRGRRASRKERRAAERALAERARAERERRRRRQRVALVGIPLLTGLMASVGWLLLDDTRLVGVTILIGGLLFLMVALAGLGQEVRARDRLRSGAIDFGAGKDR